MQIARPGLTTHHAKCMIVDAMAKQRRTERSGKMATGSGKFGEWLRVARKRQGYSQNVVAELLGVSARTVSQWERGKQTPPGYAQEGILVIIKSGLRIRDYSGKRAVRRDSDIDRVDAVAACAWGGRDVDVCQTGSEPASASVPGPPPTQPSTAFNAPDFGDSVNRILNANDPDVKEATHGVKETTPDFSFGA